MRHWQIPLQHGWKILIQWYERVFWYKYGPFIASVVQFPRWSGPVLKVEQLSHDDRVSEHSQISTRKTGKEIGYNRKDSFIILMISQVIAE